MVHLPPVGAGEGGGDEGEEGDEAEEDAETAAEHCGGFRLLGCLIVLMLRSSAEIWEREGVFLVLDELVPIRCLRLGCTAYLFLS